MGKKDAQDLVKRLRQFKLEDVETSTAKQECALYGNVQQDAGWIPARSIL